MSDKPLNYTFPVAGTDRIAAIQSQPPYSTIDSLNVRPFDVFENRGRGGSRPGMDRFFYDQLGGGNPIRLLAVMNSVQGDNFDYWEDTFAGRSFSAKWSQAEFVAKPVIESIRSPNGRLANRPDGGETRDNYATATGVLKRGLILSSSAFTDLDATKNRVGIFIVPVDGRHQGTYFLYGRMNVSDPSANSIEAKIAFSGTGYVLTVTQIASGITTTLATSTVLNIDDGLTGWFVIETTSATTVKVTWRGSVAYSGSISAAAGADFGFAMQPTDADSKLAIGRFCVEYYRTTKFELSRPRLYASSNGILYREKWFTDTEVMPSQSTLGAAMKLFSAELYNKLYVADYDGEIIAGASDGICGSFGLTSATYPDWSALGIDINTHSLQVVSGKASGGLPGSLTGSTHRITNVGTTTLTFGSSSGVVGATGEDVVGTEIVFRIVRNPKVFTPSDNWILDLDSGATDGTGLELTGTGLSLPTGYLPVDVMIKIISGTGVTPGWYASSGAISGGLTLTSSAGANATDIVYRVYPQSFQPMRISYSLDESDQVVEKGFLPVGCRVVVRHMGALLWCGDPTAPQAFYLSRQGDPGDYDYSVVDDAQAAYAGATGIVGVVPDPIVDAMPWYRNYTFLGCRKSLHLVIGNLRAGGSVEEISSEVGIAMPGAWCIGPQNELIFLSRDGIYNTTTSCMSCQPVPFSRGRLPVELIDVSDQQCEVFMQYDVRDHGIHIYITYKDAREGISHWFCDYMTKGFFRVSIREAIDPTSIVYYPSVRSEDSAVLFGGRDGRIRRYLHCARTDDGYGFESKIVIGPVRIGTNLTDASLKSLRGVLSKDSGNIKWIVYVAETAEKVVDRYYQGVRAAEGEFEFDVNRDFHVLRRGAYVIIELCGVGDPWAMEAIAGIATQLGRFR